jgi:hypothetical protein
VFEDELGRRCRASPHVVTAKLCNLLLDPTGERFLRSHEPPERLLRVLNRHASQDPIPSGHLDEVDPRAADAQVPLQGLVFAEVILPQILREPPPALLHVRQDGQD